MRIHSCGYGGMADAPDLGSGVPDVQVQVLLPAPEAEALVGGQAPFFFVGTSLRTGLEPAMQSRQRAKPAPRARASGPVTRTRNRGACLRTGAFFALHKLVTLAGVLSFRRICSKWTFEVYIYPLFGKK